MKSNMTKLLQKVILQNSKNKKIGDASYRNLIINDSIQSEKAIKFMERLGLAYRIEYLDGIDPVEIKLPAVSLAYGKIFQGLDTIKYYGKTAFGPWPGEFEDLRIRKPSHR
jgi:hypothetical protein